MTFESLSALSLVPGAAPAVKSQESAVVRPERGGSFRDFSAVLTQAMQTQGGGSTIRDLQRQALAEPGQHTSGDAPAAQDEASHGQLDTPPRADTRTPARSTARDIAPANQELAQRARRVTMLNPSNGRGRGLVGEPHATEARNRRVASRKEDDRKDTASTPGTQGVMPNAMPVRAPAVTAASSPSSTDPTPGTSVSEDTLKSAGTPLSTDSVASSGSAGSLASPIPAGLTPPTTADNPAMPGAPSEPAGTAQLSGVPLGLTTLTLSPHLNILTPAHGIVSEQSLQAFAQSMGIEPSRLQQLQRPDATLADVTGLRAGVTASDAQLSALLPSMPVPEGKPIDLSQILPEGMSLQDLQIDLQSLPRRTGSLDLASPSTLDVLGMREGNLTLDAVPGLQEAAQSGNGEHTADNGGSMANAQAQAAPRTEAGTPAAAAQPAARSMTEHFEKLSAKLATEMAARVHEQFSQGEWKMKFALKPASLGQVDVQLEMRDGKLAAVFQADNPMTQDLLQNGSQRLRDALNQMGLSQSSVWVGDGRGQASQHGERQGGTRGDASPVSQRQDASQESVQTVSAPRRDSLSQLDFYA